MSGDSQTSGTSACKPALLAALKPITDTAYGQVTPMLPGFATAIMDYNNGCDPAYAVQTTIDNAVYLWLERMQNLGSWTDDIAKAFAAASYEGMGGPGGLSNAAIAGSLKAGGFSSPSLGDQPSMVDWSDPSKLESSWTEDLAQSSEVAVGTTDVAHLGTLINASLLKAAGGTGEPYLGYADFLDKLSTGLIFLSGGVSAYSAAGTAGLPRSQQLVDAVGGGVFVSAAGYAGVATGEALGGGPEDPVADGLGLGLGYIFSSVAGWLYNNRIIGGPPSTVDQLQGELGNPLNAKAEGTLSQMVNDQTQQLESADPHGQYAWAEYDQAYQQWQATGSQGEPPPDPYGVRYPGDQPGD